MANMTRSTPIETDAPLALLSLLQWLSPAFPTGGFAWSHGLEQAVCAGSVTDSTRMAAWLDEILIHGTGWSDAVLIACALRGGDLDLLTATATALALTTERRAETLEQGAAFAAARSAMTGRPHPPRPLPLAYAEAARDLALPPAHLIAAYLHAFAANLTSAAVRFIPLGQADGQRLLAARHPAITRAANAAADATLDDLGSSAFRAEMQAMWHETLDVRIFRS